ncbi:hypothetical protein EDC96DRAFT_545390 [Choanephora cucurbitarum]|nr:hypothetical protein EDC96DRAFT_545390 [Choanephora cucurbitarum]
MIDKSNIFLCIDDSMLDTYPRMLLFVLEIIYEIPLSMIYLNKTISITRSKNQDQLWSGCADSNTLIYISVIVAHIIIFCPDGMCFMLTLPELHSIKEDTQRFSLRDVVQNCGQTSIQQRSTTRYAGERIIFSLSD